MKLIIQIPCYNEEETLPRTVAGLPSRIEGIDEIEILIIDDGSQDRTVDVARSLGIKHILSLGVNRGLARAFSAGLEFALGQNADLIINTDGDNQYLGEDVACLVKPILNGEADIVIGARPIDKINDFSFIKKKLQRTGSWIVSALAGVKVRDAVSGFRAFNREAASRLMVTTPFTYTLDTIFQAPSKGLIIRSVPVRTNPRTRSSRLFDNIPLYLWRSMGTIFRVFTVYKPILFFSWLGIFLFLPGLILGIRFLYYFVQGGGAGHVQSLILTAVLLLAGFSVFLTGILAHFISTNRKVLEEILYRQRMRTGFETGNDYRKRASDPEADDPKNQQ